MPSGEKYEKQEKIPLKKLIKKLREAFLPLPEISFAYLFCSQVSGTIPSFSDIEVAVYLLNNTPENKLRVLKSIPEELKIELTFLNTVTPLLGLEIIDKGILIFEKDRLIRSEFVYHTLREGLDLKEWLETVGKTS